MVVVQVTQVAKHLSGKHTSGDHYLRLAPFEADAMAFPVIAGLTAEVDVCSYWLPALPRRQELRRHAVARSRPRGNELYHPPEPSPTAVTLSDAA